MAKKKLGKYELLEELGRGGFGTVYRARDITLDVERAVKVLHPALVSAPEFITRFKREAKFAARLEHPSIVPVYELGEVEGSYFLTMKFMPGGSLKDTLVREGKLPFVRALEIARQIAAGLDHAHKQGLVHRDIKPANILFEGDPLAEAGSAIRLSDFGFAKALSGAGNASLSASGGMIGTPPYMAPEVWKGENISPMTDVYSLACVFFEMITGQVLFEGDSPPQVMTRHILEGPKFPEHWPEGTPEGFGPVLARALERDPASRYAGTGIFVSAIGQLSMAEQARREAQAGARSLIREAGSLLDAGALEEAHEKLLQASSLAPDLAEIPPLMARAEEAIKLITLYESAAGHFRAAKEEAATILTAAPAYPDPAGIFPSLGLRAGEKVVSKKPVSAATGELRPRFAEKSMPYLLILLGLATGIFYGAGLLGLIAGIGLFWHKNWARRLGMVFAGLLEAAGIAATWVCIGILSEGVWLYDTNATYYLPIMAISVVVIFIAIFCLKTLGGARMAVWTGGRATQPAGFWAIFTAYIATILGIPPAVLMLKHKPHACLWGKIHAIFLLLAGTAFGIFAFANTYIFTYDYSNNWQYQYLGTNYDGQVLIAITIPVFIGLCLWAFFYLKSRCFRMEYEGGEQK